MLVMHNAPESANAPAMPNSKTASALAPSTIIQELGLTFAQAESRIIAGMKTPTDHLPAKEADAFSEKIAVIAHAVHSTAPSTLSDAIVKLRLATGPLGLEASCGDCLTESIGQVTEFLERFHRDAAGSR